MYKQNKNNASQYPTDPLNLEMTKTLKQFRKISLQKAKDHHAPNTTMRSVTNLEYINIPENFWMQDTDIRLDTVRGTRNQHPNTSNYFVQGHSRTSEN